MLEAGRIEIPFDGSGHLGIPVKALKVRLVTVHTFHMISFILQLRHFFVWVSIK